MEAVDVDLSTLTRALNQLTTCSPETQMSLVNDLRSLDKWHIDPEACINITLDVADFERVALNVYNLGYQVFLDSVTVVKDIGNCKSELPDVFNLLECSITQLEASGPMVTNFLEGLKAIINQIHVDTDQIIRDVKECFDLKKLTLGPVLHKIYHQC